MFHSKRTLLVIKLAATLIVSIIFILPVGAQTETVLYSFNGIARQAYFPSGGLTFDSKRVLYGTTSAGGAYGCGSVYEFAPTGTLTVLHSFSPKGGDGNQPTGGIVLDASGRMYGTTFYGGAYGYGTVFRMTPNSTGTIKILHSFGDHEGDGNHPYAGVVLDQSGNIYGTTVFGGEFNRGTVFKVTPSGEETVLYSFGSQAEDGERPYGALIFGNDGTLYGTTQFGGTYGAGTIFEVTPAGNHSVLHSFNGTDGGDLFTSLTRRDDSLYGTSATGGEFGHGVVFKLSPTGELVVIHSFARFSEDGYEPSSAVIFDEDGNLYGTTHYGGAADGSGTVFKISSDGTKSVIHDFGGLGDGFGPLGRLVLDDSGALYGITELGGNRNNGGTIYKLTP